jgi:hypothetical protein
LHAPGSEEAAPVEAATVEVGMEAGRGWVEVDGVAGEVKAGKEEETEEGAAAL